MAEKCNQEKSNTSHLTTFTVAETATSFSFLVVNVACSFMLPQLPSNKWMVDQVFEYPIGWNQFVPIVIAVYFRSAAIRSKRRVVSLLLALLAMYIYYAVLAPTKVSGTAEGIAAFLSLIALKRSLLLSALWLKAALIILFCSLRRKRNAVVSRQVPSAARTLT